MCYNQPALPATGSVRSGPAGSGGGAVACYAARCSKTQPALWKCSKKNSSDLHGCRCLFISSRLTPFSPVTVHKMRINAFFKWGKVRLKSQCLWFNLGISGTYIKVSLQNRLAANDLSTVTATQSHASPRKEHNPFGTSKHPHLSSQGPCPAVPGDEGRTACHPASLCTVRPIDWTYWPFLIAWASLNIRI